MTSRKSLRLQISACLAGAVLACQALPAFSMHSKCLHQGPFHPITLNAVKAKFAEFCRLTVSRELAQQGMQLKHSIIKAEFNYPSLSPSFLLEEEREKEKWLRVLCFVLCNLQLLEG